MRMRVRLAIVCPYYTNKAIQKQQLTYSTKFTTRDLYLPVRYSAHLVGGLGVAKQPWSKVHNVSCNLLDHHLPVCV